MSRTTAPAHGSNVMPTVVRKTSSDQTRQRTPMPGAVAPMLATAGQLPARPGDYAFEYKWDGVRAIASVETGGVALHSRNGIDITFKYPELQPLARALDNRRVILDGEIVTLDDAGRPSFPRLQQRIQVSSRAAVARVVDDYPVWLVLFDVLWIDGQWVTDRLLAERRELLEELTVEGASWQVSPAHVGEGKSMLETARLHGLEGIVAKRLDSVYAPGIRSSAWIKTKLVHRQEFVVGGWVPEGSARSSSRVGSMLLGYYDCAGKLRYAGRVGTGLNAAWHDRFTRQFATLAQESSPFGEPVPRAGVRFLKPRLVVEVEYRRWPKGSLLQQGAFKGLRSDKDAREVVKEM
jgi:bifunctional non-homologous end joining protein LigD